MKKIFLLFLAVSVLMIGCGKTADKKTDTAANKKGTDDFIARVGDFELPKKVVDYYAEQSGKKLTKEQLDKIKDNWVETALMARAAADKGLDKKEEYNWQLEQAKINILAQLMISDVKEEIMKSSVSEENIKKFYDDNPQYFQKPGKVHARHILVPLAKDASKDDAAKAMKEIEKIRVEALKPGADFAALAEKYNPGSAGTRKGDLGWFSKKEMIAPISEAAFTMKTGEISKVLKSQFGFHIIQVIAKDVQPLDEVKDQIKDEIVRKELDEKVKGIIDNLKKTVKVEKK